MSPVASLAGAYRVPKAVLTQPPDGSSVVALILQWATDPGMAKSDQVVYFHAEIATDPAFANIIRDYFSWVPPFIFYYNASGPNLWTRMDFGLQSVHLGLVEVQCRTDLTTPGTYYWRARSEQLI